MSQIMTLIFTTTTHHLSCLLKIREVHSSSYRTIEQFLNFKLRFLNDPQVEAALNIIHQYFYLVGSVWFFIEAIFLQYQIAMNVFNPSSSLKERLFPTKTRIDNR